MVWRKRKMDYQAQRYASRLARKSKRAARGLLCKQEPLARRMIRESERLAHKLGRRSASEAPSAGRIALAVVGSLMISLLGGLLLFSRLFVPRRLPLVPAIDARQTHAMMPSTGMINYYADSSALGRPVVLIHSVNAAASAYEMRTLFELFRGTRPVFALDLPGFGSSERSNRHYSPEFYVRAIVEFLEREVGERADVIALSLSSEFAAKAALQRPDLFETLVMISPSGMMANARQNTSQAAKAAGKSRLIHSLLSFPLWSQALYDLLTTRMSIRSFLRMSFVGEPPAPLVEYAYAAAHQPGARHAPFAFVSGSLFTPDICEQVYEKLELPVLVIFDHDPYVDFDLLPDLVENLPNWNVAHIMPTQGMPHWEMLDTTANALESFWSVLTPSNSR